MFVLLFAHFFHYFISFHPPPAPPPHTSALAIVCRRFFYNSLPFLSAVPFSEDGWAGAGKRAVGNLERSWLQFPTVEELRKELAGKRLYDVLVVLKKTPLSILYQLNFSNNYQYGCIYNSILQKMRGACFMQNSVQLKKRIGLNAVLMLENFILSLRSWNLNIRFKMCSIVCVVLCSSLDSIMKL